LPKLRLNVKYQKFNIIYPISLILLIISIQGIHNNSVLGSLSNLISHVDEIDAEEKHPKSKRIPIDKVHSIKNRNYNVVLYINESLRAKNMSQYGYKRETDILTKKIFKNGFKFNYHIANAASTAPSLEVILSGCKSRSFEPQTRSQPLLWNYFSENYKTAYISSHYIEESYFDFFMSSSIKFQSSALSPNASSGRSDFETLLESEKFFTNVRESNDRFAIVFNSIANHYPYLQDPDYIKYTPYSTSLKNVDESINAYDNTIKITDAVFDQFVKQLKSFGFLDNTIIIYTSDHGQAFNEKGTFTHGSHVWQEILHVPLLVHLPQGITQNLATSKYNNFIKNQSSITSHEDLLPTIFDLFDCKIPEYLNGKSLFSQIPDRDIYSSTISNRYSVISTKDKSKRIIQNLHNDQNTTDDYKLGIDFDEYQVEVKHN
ncbi:sulfatase-like hydrolase/transferase, partial [Opitutales bacterium]|nr:sulfatase-like hydrolase/transferase [Opitutales bacterium]